MSRQLKHSEVIHLMSTASEAKIINLDASIRSLIEPTAASMRNVGDEVAIHVLCCNEYALVTGRSADLDLGDIRQQLSILRETLERKR